MSTKLVSWVWDGCASAGMKITSVAIMARLADYSNDDGVCWPSVENIARQLGAGPSTIRTAISKLEKDGWLTRKQRRNGNRNAPNVYRLNVAKLCSMARPHQSVFDPSKFDASKSNTLSTFDPPESGGDPSVKSKHDPSDKKPSCPDASPPDTPPVENISESDFLARHPDAVVCSPKKRQWGSQEDLTCAQWIWKRVIRLYEQAAGDDGEIVRPREPNWTNWANEVRLMRSQDGRTHRQICELFDRVNRDPFWCRNVLSPSKLRIKWDELMLKLSSAPVYQRQSRDELDFDSTDWIYGIEEHLQRMHNRGDV
ncbi:helix-turn-helix domain-containing protein [Pantoea stewartii]|uniref:helix-turn-helix domain-containing protein n=1 Tax=Pantoea stewartii TaxID=66269 RepID=UPI00138FBA83|nr:helix-turn-helix domain-containing protein [Pantoea stewartii]